jgi:hypothetical protein
MLQAGWWRPGASWRGENITFGSRTGQCDLAGPQFGTESYISSSTEGANFDRIFQGMGAAECQGIKGPRMQKRSQDKRGMHPVLLFILLGFVAAIAVGIGRWINATAVPPPGPVPKVVTLEVTGSGAKADLTIGIGLTSTQQLEVDLPWRNESPLMAGSHIYLAAQAKSYSAKIMVRVLVDGAEVRSVGSSGDFVIASTQYTCCGK